MGLISLPRLYLSFVQGGMMVPVGDLREKIAAVSPNLWNELGSLAAEWTAPILGRLDSRRAGNGFPKTINDPVWGVIELYPWETVLLDSPLLQRLRGVRQLGMAHHVYPGAGHDRLEHSRGVVEAAERMMRALERNAGHRKKFGADADQDLPHEIDHFDYVVIRIAALLHDIGHGPFSHAIEPLLKSRLQDEFDSLKDLLLESFQGATHVSASEMIAIVLVMSPAMKRLFEHPNFDAHTRKSEMAVAVSARLLGARCYLKTPYLSSVISGPLDADKLDYMARDSHHSGLPLGLDLDRLISKLEVVIVTPQNAPNVELCARATNFPNQRYYDIGISLSGLGAYEQMIISRVILYDRIYYHHKVRSAEAMMRRLVGVAEEEAGEKYRLKDLLMAEPDDSVIGILGGRIIADGIQSGQARARQIGNQIKARDLYYRAFAFAARFIDALPGVPEEQVRDTRVVLWRKILRGLSSHNLENDLGREIFAKAQALAQCVDELRRMSHDFREEHVLVDLAPAEAVVRGGDILTRTEDGAISSPNLFFDPEKWSQAYEQQKQCGFVFCPKNYLPLVALASQIVFFEKFQFWGSKEALRASKTNGTVEETWVRSAIEQGLCSEEFGAAYRRKPKQLNLFSAGDFIFPFGWRDEDPGLADDLVDALVLALPAGLPVDQHSHFVKNFEHLTHFLQMMEEAGHFLKKERLSEKELQEKLRDHLRSRDVAVEEGSEISGGETDLILPGKFIVENKVISQFTEDPFAYGENYGWQARRYAIPFHRRISFVFAAYRPKDEKVVLPMTKRVKVMPLDDSPELHVQVRLVIPWGHGVPSRARQP